METRATRLTPTSRLTGISYRLSQNQPTFAQYAYSYDSAGNRTRAVEMVLATEDEGQAALPGGSFLGWLGRPAGASAPLRQAPIIRDRAGYRATFDETGLRFFPKRPLLAVGDYHLAYQLTTVRRGQDVIVHPGQQAPTLRDEDTIVYSHESGLNEEYAATAAGVEQRFVFAQPLTGTGDLVVEGNLTGNLRRGWQESTGEIQFLITTTGEVLANYGRAIVQDAAGRRLAARLELDGAHLRIVVPGDWLAQAIYPVVIDPLIGTNFAVSTQEAGGPQDRVAAAYGGASATLVVWTGNKGLTGEDILGQLVSAEGELLSPTLSLVSDWDNQRNPAVAANPPAGYLVIWQSYGMLSGWDLQGQRLSLEGQPIGTRLDMAAPGDETDPAVAANGETGEYLITWRSSMGIYARIVSAEGNPGAPFQVSTTGFNWGAPAVAYHPGADQYLVTWAVQGGMGWTVVGRLVNADGSTPGAELDPVAGPAYLDEIEPALTYGASRQEYLLVYQQVNYSTGETIRGQRLDSSGGCLGDSFAVSETGPSNERPAVVYGAALGEYLVTWQGSTGSNGPHDLYAQRVTALGALQGQETALTEDDDKQNDPAVVYHAAAGEYLAAWQDLRSQVDWEIYARRIQADGNLAGQEVLVSSTPLNEDQQEVAAAYSAHQGLYLAIWRDMRADSGGDLSGQLIGPGGALVGAALPIDANPAAQAAPAVAYDPSADQFLVVWQQAGNGWDVYARRVNGQGVPVGVAFSLAAGASDQTAPAVAYNDAAGAFLVIWEDSRNGNADLYGRPVAAGGPGTEMAIRVAAGDQRRPALAAGNADGYLVTWEENATPPRDVQGLRLDVSGAPRGDVVAIATGAQDEGAPAVVYGAEPGLYLVTWEQGPVSKDILMRFVAPDDPAIQQAVLTVTAELVSEEAPAVIYGSATAEWVVAWQQNGGGSGWDIGGCVLNTAGQVLGGADALAVATGNQEAVALAYDPGRGRTLAVWQDGRNAETALDVYAQLAKGYTTVIEYQYDPLYRLTDAHYSDGADYEYQYDAVGNRLAVTDTTAAVTLTTYSYDAADRAPCNSMG